MSSPRIAIVIYSMYGHIAKCMLCSTIVQNDWYADPPLLLVAEAVKIGIASKGGKATIYQCVIIQFFPLHSPKNNIQSSWDSPRECPYSYARSSKAQLSYRYPWYPQRIWRVPLRDSHAIWKHACPIQGMQYRHVTLGVENSKILIQSFWDATGQLWAAGALAGKYAGIFVSTAGLGGGQEATVIASLSTLVHNGIIFVPLGYSRAFPQLTNLDEVHGGMISSTLEMNDVIYITWCEGSPWGAGTFASSTGTRQTTKLELEVAEIQGASFQEILARTAKR